MYSTNIWPCAIDNTMQSRTQQSAAYQEAVETLSQQIRMLNSRSRLFIIGDILSFLGIIFFLVLITLSDDSTTRVIEGAMSVVMAAVYIVVRNRDVKNSERMARIERLRKAYQNEAAALNGDFSAFDDGQRYVDAHHPFTYDLDIFGRESLFQRINRTVTTGGADNLATRLRSVDTHPTVAAINACRDAVSELSGRGDGAEAEAMRRWRMRFMAFGVDGKIDTTVVLRELPYIGKVVFPSWFQHGGLKALLWAMVVGFLLSIVLAVEGVLPAGVPIVWLFLNFGITQSLAQRRLRAIQSAVMSLHGDLQPLMRLVRHIQSATFRSEVARKNAETIRQATESLEQLAAIVGTMVLRGHGLYLFLSDSILLRGLFLAIKFAGWQHSASDKLDALVAAVAELDAIVSMGELRSESRAEVVEEKDVLFRANGLGHPFLGEHAVTNDFVIDDRNFYIITGANMAGKSTFLRAVGVNYVLAMNGMPVFADQLTVSRFQLFTSMRTSDDLAHGISYFNAELLRLQQLIDRLDATPDESTLIILDEILKGTNSLDKLNGSRLFLQAMEQRPVTGLIATHDLELSKMAADARFHNFCFEIALGDDVTYSYKITPGVARNQNATFLLEKLIGHRDFVQNIAQRKE